VISGFAVFRAVRDLRFFGIIAASIASLCLYLFVTMPPQLYARRTFRKVGGGRWQVIVANALAPFLAQGNDPRHHGTISLFPYFLESGSRYVGQSHC
jgi:hypothetical protein